MRTLNGINDPSKLARSLSLRGWGLIGLLLRASNEGLLRPRVARAKKNHHAPSFPLFREQENDQAAARSSHVSIISNRASNSCPQAVQRMQSDSTVITSDLTPMPPQSGQRAR